MCELDPLIIQKLDDVFKTYSCFDKTKNAAFVKNNYNFPKKHKKNNKIVTHNNTIDREMLSMMNKLNNHNYNKFQDKLITTLLTPDNYHVIVNIILNSVETNSMYIDLITRLLKSMYMVDTRPDILSFIESVETTITDPYQLHVLKNTEGYDNFCTSNKMKSILINKIKFCMLLKIEFSEFEQNINHLVELITHAVQSECHDILLDVIMQTNVIPQETIIQMYNEFGWDNILSPRIKILLNLRY